MSESVVVHNTDRIHGLLCGKQQQIGSTLDDTTSVSDAKKGKTDFSKYQFPTPTEPKLQISDQQTPINDSKQQGMTNRYNKLQSTEREIEQIEGYLQMYETNHFRKAMILHQEMEKHYLRPMAKKLLKKVRGPAYDDFVKKRQRAVSAFDTQAKMNVTFQEDLPEIPYVAVRTDDLTDPVHKYKKAAQREAKLTEVIAKSTGEWREKEEIIDRDTLDLKKWTRLTETRFYHGKTEVPTTKGKRVFQEKYRSNLGIDTQYNSPVPERNAGVRRSLPSSSIDHILFND